MQKDNKVTTQYEAHLFVGVLHSFVQWNANCSPFDIGNICNI